VTLPDSGLQAVVSRRALERRHPPGFVYHEPPMSDSDSGWSVLVGDESPAELDDPLTMLTEPLHALVAQWPDLEAVFAAAEAGSAWEWDDDSAAYVRRTSGS
jgi:hypothetical protein